MQISWRWRGVGGRGCASPERTKHQKPSDSKGTTKYIIIIIIIIIIIKNYTLQCLINEGHSESDARTKAIGQRFVFANLVVLTNGPRGHLTRTLTTTTTKGTRGSKD